VYSRRSLLTGFLLLPLLAACGRSPAKDRHDELIAWPAQDRWPAIFYQASPEAQEAHRYAVTHPEILQYFPCYCGCVEWGHRSVLDCSVREFRADGSVVLDSMTFG
jgi:hypothetical protein